MKARLRKGFTLVELMITLAILGVILVGLYKVNTENSLFHRDNLLRQKAVWLLKSQAEIITAAPPAEIKETPGSPFSDELKDFMGLPEARGTMAVEEVSRGLKRITLKISWRDARVRTRSLSLVLYRYHR